MKTYDIHTYTNIRLYDADIRLSNSRYNRIQSNTMHHKVFKNYSTSPSVNQIIRELVRQPVVDFCVHLWLAAIREIFAQTLCSNATLSIFANSVYNITYSYRKLLRKSNMHLHF